MAVSVCSDNGLLHGWEDTLWNGPPDRRAVPKHAVCARHDLQPKGERGRQVVATSYRRPISLKLW